MWLSLLQWAIFASVSFWLTKWKEKQLEKVSTRWKPRESSIFKLSKEEILFKQLLESTTGLLIFNYCLEVRWIIVMWYSLAFLK